MTFGLCFFFFIISSFSKQLTSQSNILPQQSLFHICMHQRYWVFGYHAAVNTKHDPTSAFFPTCNYSPITQFPT